jgi:hypothetical protein
MSTKVKGWEMSKEIEELTIESTDQQVFEKEVAARRAGSCGRGLKAGKLKLR